MDFINALSTLLENFSEFILPHAPFVGVMLILLIIGHRMSARVFTKPRAYRYYGATARGKLKWRFFYWGRETLPMQPILLGVLIGLAWKDPENLGWNRAASIAYFASAGAMSMMVWAIMKAWTKKKGLILQLPGESEPPAEERLPYDSLLAPPRVPTEVGSFEAPEEVTIRALPARMTVPPQTPPTGKKP